MTNSSMPADLSDFLLTKDSSSSLYNACFASWSAQTLLGLGINPSEHASPSISPWKKAWIELVARWSDVVAISGGSSLTLIRLFSSDSPKLRTAPTPNTEVLSIIHEAPRSSKSPLDKIFVSAWSYDPRTLTPIIAFGGEKGTIYLWRWRKGRTGDADGEEGGVWERLRVLRGHGGDVYALAFHPFHPHILASASNDLTIRLWSIFASDPPPDTYSAPPIAEGDEGDTLVCVLAGGGKGGHNQAVLSVAFHPTLPLLATGGADYALKIWPLPAFPPLFASSSAFPRSTSLVHHPLFSTLLLHRGPISDIHWYGESSLISFALTPSPEAVLFSWLGLERHFPREEGAARLVRFGDELVAESLQYRNSRSFRIHTRFSPSSPNLPPPLHQAPMLRHARLALSPCFNTSNIDRLPYFAAPTRSHHIYRSYLRRPFSSNGKSADIIAPLVLQPSPPPSPPSSHSSSTSSDVEENDNPDKTVRRRSSSLRQPSPSSTSSARPIMDVDPPPQSRFASTKPAVKEGDQIHSIAISPSGRWAVGLTRRGLKVWEEEQVSLV